MNTQQKLVKDLKPYANNPRKNDAAVDAVAESIKQYGFLVPLVITKDNEIVAGDTRYKAAKKLKLKEVPCVIADELTDEQIKAFRLVDNKVGEIAEWDVELLAGELESISADLSGFGFELPAEDITDDEPPATSDDKEFNYQEQYGVIVICQDEAHQEEVYEKLAGLGYECRVVAT